jgi:hypothetical protein
MIISWDLHDLHDWCENDFDTTSFGINHGTSIGKIRFQAYS